MHTFSLMLESALEGFIVQPDGTLLHSTRAFAALLGYPPEETVGKRLHDFILPDDHARLNEHLRSGEAEQYEVRGVRKSGELFPLELGQHPQPYEGGMCYAVTARDIRSRKNRIEREREQRQYAEALAESAAALNSSLDVRLVMARIAENVGRVVPNDAVNVMLIEGEIVRFVYWSGYPTDYDSFFREFAPRVYDLQNLNLILQTGQPMAIPDTHTFEGWMLVRETSWVRSIASAPIRSDGRVLGFINLDSRTVGAMQPHHAERLQAFADQVAVALKNARLYEDARQQASQLEKQIRERQAMEDALARRNLVLETLNEISRTAFSRLEVGYIADTVARLVTHIMDATSVYVCDWDAPNRTTTVLAEYVSPRANRLEQRSDLGATYSLDGDFDDNADWLYRANGYQVLDVRDTRTNNSELEHIRMFGGKVVLKVPIRLEDNPIGYIAVWDTQTYREFTAEEIGIVQAIARQFSSTLDKARLHSALQASEARARAIIDVLPDMVLRVSREGEYLDIRIPPNTPFWEDVDFRGKRVEDILPPELARQALENIRATLDRGEMHVYEFSIPVLRKLRTYEARLVVYAPGEVLAIIRDITQRKRIEEELAAARDAALRANLAKSQFMANMSHELRTPLNSIINYTALMLQGVYGPLSNPQSERLYKVARNGKNLLALINDVLDISTIEAGQMTLRRKRVDALDLLNGVLEILQPMAEERQLDLRYAGGDLPDLDVDETRARQVLTNIIGNGIKFTPHGSVTVRTERRDDMLAYIVQDTGIGIPAEALERIFEAFHQADNSSTRNYDGTGLGLTISRRIVEMHGGRIEVESRVNEGSTFTVYLPVMQRQRSELLLA